MNILFIICFLISARCVAENGIFSFKDIKGYEKCLGQDHLVDVATTETGSQKRLLTQPEIQERCIESAVTLLSNEKDKNKMLNFVRTTKRKSTPQASLPLLPLLVTIDLASCNEMEIYEVLLKGLSYPKHDYLAEVNAVVKICWKDRGFRKDFLEEKDNANAFIGENACQILLEAKAVKNCRKE